MYAGRIVEQARVGDLFGTPAHPYTQALLASIPSGVAGTRLPVVEGSVPTPGAMPPGCAFAPRCRARLAVCCTAVPPVTTVAPGHEVACFLHGGTGHS
jgi:oligopeptide/dipeptide ABC transporter ATP-binding protein